MNDMRAFLNGLGVYAPAFVILTGATLWQMLEARTAASRLQEAAQQTLEQPRASAGRAALLGALGDLDATTDRASLLLQSGPTLALLGTCMGFYWALQRLAGADLGGDPLELLVVLMQSGVGTALATTVIGQALYLALGELWALVLAGRSARARVAAAEALAILRSDPPGSPWPRDGRPEDQPTARRSEPLGAPRMGPAPVVVIETSDPYDDSGNGPLQGAA